MRGNDRVTGGFGNNYLNGTGFAPQGRGERDVLISSSYGNTDTFVLGERQDGTGRVFYNDFNNSDYAVLQNFDLYNVAGEIADRIQLMGSASSYSLANVNVGGVVGAGISFLGDLIGVVQGVNAGAMNLSDTNQFTYV